jgi:hypothetical protein
MNEGGFYMLAKFQMWLFSKGAEREDFTYERIGNFIQDIRTKVEQL